MNDLFLLIIALGGVYLAGRSFYGRQYSTRHYFGDLAFSALLIIAGFGLAFLLLTLLGEGQAVLP